MKKYLFPLVLCTVLGIFMGTFLIKQYSTNTLNTFSEKNIVYFLKLGVYDTKELMDNNTKDFNYYIYREVDSKFHVYVAITKNKDNLEKLKGYFKNKGYIINEEEFDIKNESFITVLNQYDELLKNTDDEKTISAICNQILSKYEEESRLGNNDQTNAS